MSDGTRTPAPGPGRSFARSLYWRIGFGFILFLAVTLVLQVALFIWVAGETEGGMPERMGRDFAELVASEFESALARDPKLDLRAYAERRIKELHRPAAIIFPDGTSVAPEGTDVPRGMRFPGPFRRRGGGSGGPPDPAVPLPEIAIAREANAAALADRASMADRLRARRHLRVAGPACSVRLDAAR